MGRPVSPPRDLLAKLFRGLGDPSRLEILQALLDGPRNVSEVVEATGLSQPSASTHLSCLRCCGLVEKSRRGRFVYYRISAPEVRRLLVAGDRLLETVAEGVDACERYEGRKNGAKTAPRSRRWA